MDTGLDLTTGLTLAGFVLFIWLFRAAMRRRSRDWDELWRKRRSPPSPPRRWWPVLLIGAALGVAGTSDAQQTIFNVPSADVLDPGKVYLEVDDLFRPTQPRFSSTTVRGVVGVVRNVEAGVNFGGFVSPGDLIPTATVALKVQPVRVGGFALTAGGFGLFFLRGARDGDPAGLGYSSVGYRLQTGMRITLGGWYASGGYAKPDRAGGALSTFEQSLPWVKGLTLAADWYSGNNSIGYLSPGFIYTTGHWTAYASWSFKNGDSRGNGGLLELGYLF